MYHINCIVSGEVLADPAKKGDFIHDLYTRHLHAVRSCWFEIGVLLGVPTETLVTIDSQDKLITVIDVSL